MKLGDFVIDNQGTTYKVVLVGVSEFVAQAGDPADPEFYVFERDGEVWQDASEPDIHIVENLPQ
jgi:hypothetical protein